MPRGTGSILGINPLTAPDSISRTDEIKIGRNGSIRATRINHHAPLSFNVNLQRRDRVDVVEIDIGCHAIHIIPEYTIPKENEVSARPILRSIINPVTAVELVLLSDIAVGGDLSACLSCPNRIHHRQGKLRTARRTNARNSGL